ncbi:MAG TPA: hypothetical protein IGS37_11180 [Synechococcales cyanobacterium M55_K2018_004]|nr:hypothetical protein [Synechococcales cyanobacterium M55_K2018_004]
MGFYTAYGFTLDSELPLPELVATDVITAEVQLFHQPIVTPILQPTESRCLCHITPMAAYLFWEEAGTFLVKNGREIVVDLLPQADPQMVRLFLLGAAFGTLLHQRGLMTLHASTVEIDGEALLFVGDRGMGKSTTAAALMARGYRVLSDDIAAFELPIDCRSPSSPPTYPLMVFPGYPQLKLWADAATQLGHQPAKLPRLHPDFDKYAHRYSQGFSLEPVPLRAIYVLGFGDTLEIAPLTASSALAAVMRNWYCARFGQQMLEMVGMATHFQRCTELVRRVPLYYLQRSGALTELEAIARCVEQHFTQVVQPFRSTPA